MRIHICGSSNNPEVWRDVGRELLGDILGEKVESELNAINVNSHGNVIKCCSDMFSLWLERQPEASWTQLINALRNVNLMSLATKVENLLIQSTADPQGIDTCCSQ